MNEMKKWKTIVSVVLVFLLGSLSGALVTHKIDQHRMTGIIKGDPKAIRELIVRRLNHKLHLDSSQEEQLRAILKETHEEMRNVRKQFKPQIEEILMRSQNRVRTILRPDQLAEYEKIVEERKKKREKKENSE